MLEKEKYLIVVSVLEGRNFPKRHRYQLIAEVRFDGELLATDAVDHDTDRPNFTQELAWELDKKTLHQHKLQRTAIKVQVYALNPQTSVREAVGYVMLDLRSAQNKQNAKWMNLLHTKYQRSRPEIKIGVYIDEDKGPPATFKAKGAPPRPQTNGTDSKSTETSSLDARLLKPLLNESEGFYQIGPPAQCNEIFVISVTVAFAANLTHLIPSDVPLPGGSNQFFFYYSLLGNDVTNESFTDLVNPSFPAERASVKIRSSVEILRSFFLHQPGIEIHLCCGDQSLGCGEVSLSGLLQKGSTEIYMKPVTIEGAFQLNPPKRSQTLLSRVPDNMKPVVGVSVVLRKEDLIPTKPLTPVKEQMSAEEQRALSSPPVKDSKKKSPIQVPTAEARQDQSVTDHETFEESIEHKAETRAPPKPTSKKDRPTSAGHAIRGNMKSTKAQPPVEAEVPTKLPPSPVTTPKKQNQVSYAPPDVSPIVAGAHHPMPNATTAPVSSTRHYCCSIDLRSVRNLDIHHAAFVFVRYTYGFFGSAAPIVTHPHIEVRRGTDVLLPQSFCAFDFATTAHQLQDTFTRVPLLVEVWDRDKHKSQNSLLGAAHLPLSQVLAVERLPATHPSGTKGFKQTWNGSVPIVSVESGNHKMGELQVMLSLEDWGEIHTVQQAAMEPAIIDKVEAVAPSPPPPPADPREAPEYKIAMELEQWKEQQEEIFESQLKDKEQKYMKTVAAEWKRREKERELIVQKKVMEYQQLEEQLRKTISDLDKREKQLTAGEQEVLRLRADLQRDHERKLLETREASRRFKEDCDHQIELNGKKVSELEDYILRLKQQISDAEARYKQLSDDFEKYKEQQHHKPEVRLQSEINLLTLEKVELERKLEAVTKSKVHYKQQWGRALKEMARLKQREQLLAKQELKRQQTELEHLRMRYLAAEENDMIRADRQQLSDIRSELHQLKETSSKTVTDKSADSSRQDGGGAMQPLQPDTSYGDEEHITRLIEERDTLLRTGVYTSEDRIISELDRQIREAIAKRER